MLEKYTRLKARLASLPADEASWGLIHQDAHLGSLFLRGYREEHELDPAWLSEIPHFMKLREIAMVEVIAQAYPEAGKPMDAWAEGYMKGRRERILADVPFIEFDWDSLAPHLDPAA